MRLNRIAVFVVATVCLGDLPFAPCGARDIYVPAGASIQEAVDAASPGDTILLGPGEYMDNVDLPSWKSPLALVGAGAGVTIIRALRWKYVVMAGNGARIQGLTIADGEIGVRAESDDIFVADCAFVGNRTGLVLVGSYLFRPFTVERCSFWGNGTAINVDFAAGQIRDCQVRGNETGIYCNEASPIINGCRISSNKWGIDAFDHGSPLVTNCIFRGNSVAVRSYGYSHPQLINSTFWLNNCPLQLIADYPTAITVSNCILWGSRPVVLSTRPLGSVDISYSDVEGSWPGEGNIERDPGFVNPYFLDFRLQRASPCIDAGDKNAPELPETDIAGIHRIMFGGKSLRVDMGAYEFYINKLEPVPGTNEAIFTWSSLADKSYSIFYTDDLFSWHTALDSFPSFGNTTTSWIDDGSLTGLPPSLVPKRFYRLIENP